MKVDFIYIGPGRSGSTFLYENLLLNDSIGLPYSKELNFFNNNFEKGIKWYESNFIHRNRINGELCTQYIYDKKVITRILKFYPKIKLFSIFRNPYHYTMSVYDYRRQAGYLDIDLPFNLAVKENPDLITRANYKKLYKPYKENFGSNYKIFIFEEIFEQPELFFLELQSFLGCEDFSNIILDKVNSKKTIKNQSLAKIKRIGSDWLRKKDYLDLLQKLKKNKIVDKILHKPYEKKISYNSLKNLLSFDKEINDFSECIGRDLTKIWR